jgi:biotin operon repressor
MIRAHFTLPCLYHAQEKIVDQLNIPSLNITKSIKTLRSFENFALAGESYQIEAKI